MTHFNTYEMPVESREVVPTKPSSSIKAGSMEELKDSWRQFSTNASFATADENEHFHQRRMENLAWRLMSIKAGVEERKTSLINEMGGDAEHACAQPLEVPLQVQRREREERSEVLFGQVRGRSKSNPMLMAMAPELQSSKVVTPPMSNVSSMSALDVLLDGDEVHVEANSRRRSASMSEPHRKFERAGGALGKGVLCMEYSDSGTGDFRSPSFMVNSNKGGGISPLRYKSHTIADGKQPLPDCLPGVRSFGTDDATTLTVTMDDVLTGLEVDLIYVCMHHYDAVMRRAVFRNVSSDNKIAIARAHSFTVDFESTTKAFHIVQLSGSWARERMVVESKVTQGCQSFGSMRGVSSHQHNPFAVLTMGPPQEEEGECRGFSLVYSGNFLFEVELDDMGRLRANMGIHPLGFGWNLNPGSSFNTPEAILIRSSKGLGGMSRVLHRLVLDRLIMPNWSDADPYNPPILLNSWEAKYFNVNHTGIVDMARQARKIGADLLVLDDGWFGNRSDDRSSLGDWVPNLIKFPFGLDGLAREVNELGIKFGIWVEPEMVSESSMLYQQHPDWCLHVPGRAKGIGRYQLVLDLSRSDVRDYLFDQLAALLDSANIEYVKWDMNRPLTEIFSQRPREASSMDENVWQAETGHRFVLGVYELQMRIMTSFPHVLLENCASGGGRFDMGMLFYSPQIWCSDNTDALTRMRIQYGTSLAYPARCIGAHVSCVPNHITGNYTRARTRAYMAMCGTFGYELDVAAVSPKEVELFKENSEVYRAIAPIIRRGDLYRLWNPFKVNFASWMYVSRDQTEAVVFAFSMGSDHWSNVVPRLVLNGLRSDWEYIVSEPMPNNMAQQSGNLMIIETEIPVYQLGYATVALTGSMLMHAGLPIKFYTLDDSVLFVLRRS